MKGGSGSVSESAGFVSAGVVSAGFGSAGFVSAGFVSAGFVSAGFVSAGLVSAGLVSAGLVSAGLVSAGLVSAGLVSAGLVSAGLASAGFGSAGLESAGPVFAASSFAEGTRKTVSISKAFSTRNCLRGRNALSAGSSPRMAIARSARNVRIASCNGAWTKLTNRSAKTNPIASPMASQITAPRKALRSSSRCSPKVIVESSNRLSLGRDGNSTIERFPNELQTTRASFDGGTGRFRRRLGAVGPSGRRDGLVPATQTSLTTNQGFGEVDRRNVAYDV